jgi:hypothetical protein
VIVTSPFPEVLRSLISLSSSKSVTFRHGRWSHLCTGLCISLVLLYRKYTGWRTNDSTRPRLDTLLSVIFSIITRT